jgi:hypothetical protein
LSRFGRLESLVESAFSNLNGKIVWHYAKFSRSFPFVSPFAGICRHCQNFENRKRLAFLKAELKLRARG